MKLPKLEATLATYMVSSQHYPEKMVNNVGLKGIEMSNIFDDIAGGIGDVVGGVASKAPCVLSKVGPKGVQCLLKCGPNPLCLATCAGPSLVSSIMSCI